VASCGEKDYLKRRTRGVFVWRVPENNAQTFNKTNTLEHAVVFEKKYIEERQTTDTTEQWTPFFASKLGAY
jgi:hypothetical protein